MSLVKVEKATDFPIEGTITHTQLKRGNAQTSAVQPLESASHSYSSYSLFP